MSLHSALLHLPIKRHRSCEPHLFGQAGFLIRRIVKVVWFGGAVWTRKGLYRGTTGCAGAFDPQRHWARGIGRNGARNAKVTETFYDGLERDHDVGAFVCAGRVQRVPVSAEQF